jgi:branched-chain amino acid transport system substrate-binding protein
VASIVVSVPLEGPTGEAGPDAAEGVLLAVEDAGSPVQVLVEDAGPGPCGRNVPVNAARAAANADVVAYLGEFHSAATEMALPVLEAAGLPHVSFSNTFRRLVGRSFVNVMPTDELQAAALVAWMAESGARRPFLADDGEDYGADMRWLVHRALEGLGNGVREVEAEQADAVFLGCAIDERTVALLAGLAERAPEAALFGMEGLLSDELAGELPAEVATRLFVTAGPAHGDQLPPAGREVARRLGERLGHGPDPHAVYAYEAACLVLDAFGRVGGDRAALTAAMRGTRDRDSVIGRYSFDERGATTLRAAGRLRVENRRFVPA